MTVYQVFVRPHAPRDDMGNLGDIGVETTHPQEVENILNKNKMERPKNYEKHHVYYKTEGGWTPADESRNNKGRPNSTHPKLGRSFVLEVWSFTWRHVRHYYSDHNPILDQLDSTPRDREIVGPFAGMGNECFVETILLTKVMSKIRKNELERTRPFLWIQHDEVRRQLDHPQVW
jgi:hypothetical protein